MTGMVVDLFMGKKKKENAFLKGKLALDQASAWAFAWHISIKKHSLEHIYIGLYVPVMGPCFPRFVQLIMKFLDIKRCRSQSITELA